ncbi:MAG TPA: ABC transporter C-terminal domain-containing protein, partial [Verrucomicrobiae bacterium]|nr:ABC transporter C-terminal domain-containing protein [Verrucomicrobiae bacterium]
MTAFRDTKGVLGAAARAGAAFLCLLAALPGPTARAADSSTAPAAPPGPGDAEAKIRALEARLAELEAAVKAQASPGATAAELQRRIDLLAAELEKLRLGEAAAVKPLVPAHGLGPAASRVYGVAKGVSIGGYGEAIYDNFDARDQSGAASGATDRFDFVRAVLYAGYKFTDRVVFNSELEFEHASTETGGSVSVEFAYLDFMLHPRANLRAGLILVPAGLINETHEPPTFLGAHRPMVETRIEPATWADNGAGVFGEAGGFSYRAYLLTGLDSSGFTAGEGLREGRQGGGEAKAQD